MQVWPDKHAFGSFTRMFMQLLWVGMNRIFTQTRTKMKKLYTPIIVLFSSLSVVNAQIIYTDVKPDAKFSCSKVGCSHQYDLDLNNDGANDFAFGVYKYAAPSCGSYESFSSAVYVSKLDSNEATVYPLLSLNAIINDQNIYSASVNLGSAYIYWNSNPRGGGCHSYQNSSPPSDGYLGLKLKKDGNTFYGWVRFSVSVSYKSVGFAVKDYAYNSAPNQPILAGQTSELITHVLKNTSVNDEISDLIQPSAVIQIPKVDMNALIYAQKKYSPRKNDFKEIDIRNQSDFKRERNFLSSVNAVAGEISSSQNKPTPPCPNLPVLGENFEGNALPFKHTAAFGDYFIQAESNIAISNGGKIVSISNGFIYCFNEGNTVPVFKDSLQNFCLGYFDPHVLYDAKKDRFIFCVNYYKVSNLYDPLNFKVGVEIAFSKSNDPMDGWNFYFYPDTAFDDNSVDDYPQLGMSDDEVFITEVAFDKSDHFTHSRIIQADKNAGYAGAASISSQFYYVGLSKFTKGSVVPVSGGSKTYGPNMYFMMSYENGKPSDKYYVLEMTNTIASGRAVLKTYGPVTSNISHYPKPLPYQPGPIAMYDDNNPGNDYIQGAFYENGLIQFCQNSSANGKGAVYVGRISGIPNSLSCLAQTISDPDLFLENCSIAYAGKSSTDNSIMIGIEHTGYSRYPGLSAAFIDNNFKAGPLLTVKEGNDTLNASWGDYSGICRRYNHPGECWIEGEYGDIVFPRVNWIAKLNSPPACEDQTNASKHIQTGNFNTSLVVFPNPFSNSTTILFTLSQPQKVSLRVFDMGGRSVKVLADAFFETGQHEMQWNTDGVTAGTYLLQIDARGYSETKKLSVIK